MRQGTLSRNIRQQDKTVPFFPLVGNEGFLFREYGLELIAHFFHGATMACAWPALPVFGAFLHDHLYLMGAALHGP